MEEVEGLHLAAHEGREISPKEQFASAVARRV